MASFYIRIEDLSVNGKVETSRHEEIIKYQIVFPNIQLELFRRINGEWLTNLAENDYTEYSKKAIEEYEQSLIK